MVKIFDLLAVDRITILDTHDKSVALDTMCRVLAGASTVCCYDELKTAIFERENIISTSIGLGIAIPHVRLATVTEMTIAVGISRQGIEYQSFDDQPVHIIVMIAAPEGAHREYLSVLAKIALLLKNDVLRKSLIASNTPGEVYEILKSH